MRSIAEWCKEGICRGEDEQTFFPSVGKNPTHARKDLCANCPVITECLDYAIMYDEDGVWGGLTKKQRKKLHFLKSTLVTTAKSQGVYEHRVPIDDLIQSERSRSVEAHSAVDEFLPEELEPPVELLRVVSVPTVRVAS